MKINEKCKEKKQKIKNKQIVKGKKEHVIIVAQEIKFARLLSGNEKKTRDRVLKTLKKWLTNCFQKGYEFKEDDFIRVWKGLFYAVWMSDKPLVQEELCESIASILDQFPAEQIQHAILMTKAGLKVLATEWYGIDHHRMDKFLMLVRRYLRGSLRCLLRCGWSLESCQMFSNMLTNSDGLLALKTPHYARNALSMVLHIVDCFLEEVAKVSEGEVPEDSLVELLRPFCVYTAGGEAPTLCIATRRLFTALVRQSEIGLRYDDATRAWKKMGCPVGGPEALELMSDDDEEQENGDHASDDGEDMEPESKPLDPRAGRVDVVLNPLPVPAGKIAAMLREVLRTASSKAHKRVKICMQRFERLSENEYPLPVPAADTQRDVGPKVSAAKSARSLQTLERKLSVSADELALRGLSRKHRKRLLAKSRSGASIVDDVNNSTSNSTNGNWQVETTEPVAKKTKSDDTNKENQHKNKNKNLKDKEKRKNRRNKRDSKEENKKRQKIDVKIKKDKNKKVKKELNEIKSSEVPHCHGKENNTEDKIKGKYKNKGKKDNSLLSSQIQVSEKDSGKEKRNTTILEKVQNGDKINKKIKDPVKSKVLNGDVTENKNKTTQAKENQKENNANNINKNLKTNKPTLLVNKVKNFQKPIKNGISDKKLSFDTPKKVKFVLKNNSMQGPVDYYKSVRQSPSIPFDSTKQPSKTNLKPSTPSPINPFFKKKLRIK